MSVLYWSSVGGSICSDGCVTILTAHTVVKPNLDPRQRRESHTSVLHYPLICSKPLPSTLCKQIPPSSHFHGQLPRTMPSIHSRTYFSPSHDSMNILGDGPSTLQWWGMR